MADLTPILKQFPEVGEVQEVKALTSGLINQTYLVKTLDEKAPNYVLQRINNNIFCIDKTWKSFFKSKFFVYFISTNF